MSQPVSVPPAPDRPLLLFVVTEDWYFRSHRLPTARAALAAGFKVAVATRVDRDGDAIAAEGMRVIPLGWRRRSVNPLHALGDIWRLARLYRRERPAIIHHIALKPAVLGGIAAFISDFGGAFGQRRADRSAVVSTLAGLGLVFSGDGGTARTARLVLKLALRAAGLGRPAALVVQNRDDAALLRRGWPPPPPLTLVPGSGVDLERFQPLPLPSPAPRPGAAPLITCAQVSRMLTLKGVEDVVAAVRYLRARGLNIRLILAGAPDGESRAAIPPATLEEWSREAGIEWLGAVADVRAVWARADIAVLASRGGEGVPKSLMEAAACGRPIVATDVPGNRDVALADRNALLVPPSSPLALAEALKRLATDPEMRRLMAAASRDVVAPTFGDQEIGRQMQDVYLKLLPDGDVRSRERRHGA